MRVSERLFLRFKKTLGNNDGLARETATLGK